MGNIKKNKNKIFKYFKADFKNAEKVEEKYKCYRSDFQRDRDRILYSKMFRRLQGKTQVFLADQNDHIRTRLTHTLEVAQIASSIARELNLDNDLIEAIAFGHDVGHTPFGHSGEDTLNYIMNGCDEIKDFNINLYETEKGFAHSWQSIEMLEYPVEIYQDVNGNYIRGLNLTKKTLWGIGHHTKNKTEKDCDYFIQDEKICKFREDANCGLNHQLKKCSCNGKLFYKYYDQYKEKIEDKFWSFEALIVSIADEIAQRHHDLEDAIALDLINRTILIEEINKSYLNNEKLNKEIEQHCRLPEDLLKEIKTEFKKLEEADVPNFSERLARLLLKLYINVCIENGKIFLTKIAKTFKIKNNETFNMKREEIYKSIKYEADKNKTELEIYIFFPSTFQEADKNISELLRKRVYDSYIAECMDAKGKHIIRKLFRAYLTNPELMSDIGIKYIFKKLYPEKYATVSKKDNKDEKLKEVIGKLREMLVDMHKLPSPEYNKKLLRTVCFYIASLTDNFAYNQYELIYGSERHAL